MYFSGMFLKTLGVLFFVSFAALFQGCTCCAYLNHMFNAERTYEEAAELRQTRLDSIPEDSTSLPTGDELKKYDRVIEKGSRVLERFPENERQTANAILLIGESFRHKGEWAQAIIKYDEFERYFSSHDSMPMVEYERAYCLYRNGEYNISRFALEPVLNPNHPYYYDGLNLLSLLDEQSDTPDEAILALEKMLEDSTAGTPYIRGKAHFRLAGLYYKLEKWENARKHFRAPEIRELSLANRFAAAIYSAECEVNLKHYAAAGEEYAAMMSNKEFEEHLPELMVRRAEILLLAANWTESERLFHRVNSEYPKTEVSARSYYNLGDFYQTEKRAYPEALAYYDSSTIAMSASSWGQNSRERKQALERLLALEQQNAGLEKDSAAKKPFFENEFQISELFLFRLSELDSSLARLDRIINEAEDTTLVLRATYARAFIFDEYKNEPNQAEALYREIIEKYPNTEYAKSAQSILGMRVTMKTNEDLAHEAFLHAESLWVAAEAVPLESMSLVDSAFAQAITAYDSVYRAFPKTNYGAQALFMKANLLAMDPVKKDSTIAVLIILRNEYAATPWGKEAAYLLNSKQTITNDELTRLRNRSAANEAYLEKLSKQYYESFKPVEKKPEVQQQKSTEDEILENTYNSMYDFD